MSEKYVKLSEVEKVIDLMLTRDKFHQWSNEYEKLDEELNQSIDELRCNYIRMTIPE